MKPYIYITITVLSFWLIAEIVPPWVHYFIKYIAMPLYGIGVVVFGSYSVFKRLKNATDPENIEPQDISKFERKVSEYSNKRINAFAHKLALEIKGLEEKERYSDCRHMWE